MLDLAIAAAIFELVNDLTAATVLFAAKVLLAFTTLVSIHAVCNSINRIIIKLLPNLMLK